MKKLQLGLHVQAQENHSVMVWKNITPPNLQSLDGSMQRLTASQKPLLMPREVAQDTSCILQMCNAFIDE